MPRHLLAPVSALALLAFTGACTVGPDYAGPPEVASAGKTASSFVRGGAAASPVQPGLARWWERLDDPLLTRLVDDALAHSPSIDLAQARIREAQGKLVEGRASLLPSASPNALYVHGILPGSVSGLTGSSQGEEGGGSSTAFDFYNLGANVSWEPDLWGGKRRGIEASDAQLGERYADLADAQVSLSAQVAQSYVNLRDAQNRLRINREAIARQRQALELSRQRVAAGTASDLELERLQGELAANEAQTVPLGAQIKLYENALAVLTGQAPGALDSVLEGGGLVPVPPASVAVGDPAGLIARRPDIRAAERALAASTAQIGVREAQRLPGISFMGILGIGGSDPGDALDPDNLAALLLPQISWPLLDFGKSKSRVDQARAQRDQAEAQYRQAVLKGLRDAEDSLARFGATRRQLAQLLASKESADRAAQLNAQRYKAGTSNLIDQLDIERQALNAAANVAQAKAQLTIDYIAVNKALGLGWSAPAAKE